MSRSVIGFLLIVGLSVLSAYALSPELRSGQVAAEQAQAPAALAQATNEPSEPAAASPEPAPAPTLPATPDAPPAEAAAPDDRQEMQAEEAAAPAIAQEPAPPPAGSNAGSAAGPASPLPIIYRSDADMPEPVRQTLEALKAAARSGHMAELRALMQAQPQSPSVSFGDPGDPIEYLKALSSDAEGREILAVLLELLEAGYVRVGAGTPEEVFIWPYFAQYPLEALTPEQLVELFTLVTAADYEDMRSYGAYTAFRVGIAPDGRWLFFLAGD